MKLRLGFFLMALAINYSLSLCFADEFNKRDVRVGVYYFPGWKDNAEPSRKFPWEAIQNYPERKPLLGWYREGDDLVTVQQLRWMRNYSVDYIIYDWYWTNSGKPRLSHAIESYLRVGKSDGPKFALMWANHNDVPISLLQFDFLIDYWINQYFKDERYERVGNRPLLIIFSPEALDKKAQMFGWSAQKLILRLRDRTKILLGVDPYIMGATHAVEKRVNDQFYSHGYDAYTGYNYQYGVEGIFKGANYSHSYQELDDGYRRTWRWMLRNSRLPYALPVTSGWDRRPWGGSPDPMHDQSTASPSQFYDHVKAASALVKANQDKSTGRIHVCCWNEYGEGSYIEPTENYWFQFLNALQSGVLGRPE